MVTQNVVRSGITRNVTRGVTESFFSGLTPQLHYEFAANKTLAATVGPTLSITRATNGTYRDNTGTIQTAGSNVARFDHNASGTSLGLLVEEARTNLVVQSEDFGTTWNPTKGAVATNSTVSPDGSTTADKFTCSTDTGTSNSSLQQNANVSATTTYCYSVFCKADQADWVYLSTIALGLGTGVFYDLTNGVVGTVGASSDSEGIESYGNGWYRCWFVFTTTADVLGQIGVYLADADGDIVVTQDGTNSIYLWGAQLEASPNGRPSSYIVTTTASVTRNADIDTTTDLTWLNSSEGTFYVRAQADGVTGAEQCLLEVSDGSTSDRIQMLCAATDGSFDVETYTTTGTDGAIAGTQDFVAATVSQAVAGYANNDVIAYLDGTSGGTEVSATLPPSVALTTLTVGSNQDGEYWNGHIAEIRYYNTRLTNAQLEAMSNGVFP